MKIGRVSTAYVFAIRAMGLMIFSSRPVRPFGTPLLPAKNRARSSRANATNHLRTDCSDNSLALYVNGQKLFETNDSDFKLGQVGMAVTTQPNSAPMDVHFDNFVVRVANGQTDLRRGVALHLGADDLGILECVKFRQK